MKKISLIIPFLLFVGLSINAQEPKQINECVITYEVVVLDSKAEQQVIKSMNGSVKTLYLKGTRSRTDLETSGFKQTTLYDSKNDSTVILREIGANKYISYLNGNQRKEKNKKYNNIEFTNTDERKIILGYDCKKVIAKLADGTTYTVYYTPNVIVSNSDYEYQFKNLAGLVLEYESETDDGKSKVKYVANKILFNPIPNVKFEIPKSGYRVL